jgi:hypothetical protein
MSWMPVKHDTIRLNLNQLLCTLKKKRPGICIGQSSPSAKVVAYANDVTIFVTSPADIPVIQEMLAMKKHQEHK